MTTVSIPLSRELEGQLDHLIKSGVGPTKAAVMRKALQRLAEEEAVNAILEAQQELKEGKILRGDLRELLKKV